MYAAILIYVMIILYVHPRPKVWNACKASTHVKGLLDNVQNMYSFSSSLVACLNQSVRGMVECSASYIHFGGLRMDDNAIRIIVGLHLRATLCHTHACHHFGIELNYLGVHGLSCMCEGRFVIPMGNVLMV